MKRFLVLALLFAAFGSVAAAAQSFSLVTGREPVTSLDGLWRFHTGDNPAWADPNFDDSNWPLLRSDKSWSSQGYPSFTGYAWYRFTVEVPGDGRPLALFLADVNSGYQVYVDGKLIGSAGSATATRDPVFGAPRALFPLPAALGPRSMRIGLRVWSYQPVTSWDGAGPLSRGNEVGDIALLSNHLRFLRDVRAIHFVSEYSYGLTAGLIGIAILALFLLRPQDKEYLWFAVLLLGECSDYAVHLAMNLGSLPMPLWYLLHVLIDSMSMLATLAFFSIVLHARRSLLWRAICVLVAAAPLTAALIYFQWAGMGTCFALVAVCNMPAILWILGRLLLGAFRRDASARLLLVPVALEYGVGLADTVARVVWLVKGSKVFPSAADRTLVEWPFEVSVGDVIGFIFLLALLIFLVRRFSLARKEEERMAGEFEAAKTVQSLLIPAAPPATPGFAVENVYLPAQEVGGDFFQILPGDDGSLLIVVGDVSGKGLKAAMTVSAIIGALRGCNLRAPEKVLLHLNKALRGQMSGFFTCSAALIDPDGTLTIANAGHLSPYLNGEELEVNPGLPLGIADETGYPEVTYYFGPNDRLTFVSDGVVEAQSSSGELYGFGRTQSISNQSAESIARTAQQFGQEDDITVLTVTRTPQNQPAPILADHEKGLIANLL